MLDYTLANRALWDAWSKLHAGSDYYDADGFRAGKLTLGETELEEVGDVCGKTLLHLQCHLGLDTLSWARRGAIVTGVDISGEAIHFARSLAQELEIQAEFLCLDVYELPRVLDRQFDIVFTAGGVLDWLADLTGWAALIARYLKPGGIFYIIEIHPIKKILTPRLQDDRGNSIDRGYFHRPEPVRVEERGSYAVQADSWHTAYYWSHGMGEIVTALAAAGLQLDFLHEFPSAEHPNWPVLFSIRARRVGE